MSSGRASVVKSRSWAIRRPAAVDAGHDGVADRAPHQIQGVTGRPEAVGQVGGGVDQGPEALGEHAAEGSAADLGCGSTWTGNEPEPAPRAATPAAPARPAAIRTTLRGAGGRARTAPPVVAVGVRSWPSARWRRSPWSVDRRGPRRHRPGRTPVRPGLAVTAPSPSSSSPRRVGGPGPGLRPPSARRQRRRADGRARDHRLRLPLSLEHVRLRPVPGDGPTGTPVSSTTSALPVERSPRLPGGGLDLPMPVVVGGAGRRRHRPTAAFTIHLQPVERAVPVLPGRGVPGPRSSWSTCRVGAVVGSLHHPPRSTARPRPTTQRLRVAVVLPVQITQGGVALAHDGRTPGPARRPHWPRRRRPPSTAVTATVAAMAAQHPSVPVTLQVSGQTVGLLGTTAHQRRSPSSASWRPRRASTS